MNLFPSRLKGVPTSYGVKVVFAYGGSIDYDIVEHALLQHANALLFVTTTNQDLWVSLNNICVVEFDSRWTQIKEHKAKIAMLQNAPQEKKDEN